MPNNKTRRVRIVIVVTIAALLIAAGVYRYWSGNGGGQGELVLYGNVDLREVEVAFVLQERIARLYVEEGDRVEQGQVLAELDPVRFRQAVAQREAELAAARANLRDAQAAYRRIEGLIKKKLASPQDRDDAKARLDAARARVSGAKAALARAQKDLADTKLLAPANGVIQARILEAGDIAAPQKPVFTLALLDPVWIRAYVAETDLGRIYQGMAAEVRTDSFPDKVYKGRIGYISSTAEFTPKTVQTTEVRSSLVYQVRVLVPNPHDELRLGMPATVTLSTQAERVTDPGKGNADDAG